MEGEPGASSLANLPTTFVNKLFQDPGEAHTGFRVPFVISKVKGIHGHDLLAKYCESPVMTPSKTLFCG
jgi:hypothetical protein